MENVTTLGKWLQRGRQRAAVAGSLRKPMTGSEIWRAARQTNPHIQLRDIWLIMRHLEEKKLVVCLNPRQTNGKLYSLTDHGQVVVAAAFGVNCNPLPGNVNWKIYGKVARGRIRRLVLEGLGSLGDRTEEAQTAAALRKSLRNGHPMGLNQVIRALRELESLGLVRKLGVTRKQSRKLFALTSSGQKIVEQLRR